MSAYESYTGADGSLHPLIRNSMTIDIGAVTVLNDIRERLVKINQSQIDAAGRRLMPDSKGLKSLGIVQANSTRALWALFMTLEADAELLVAKAKLAIDDAEEAEYRQQAVILEMFRDCVREMFWAQAKIDLGFYENANVGLRQGWELYELADSRPGFMATLSGGGGLIGPL